MRLDNTDKFQRACRKALARSGSLVAIEFGQSAICVAKTVARKLLSKGDVAAAGIAATTSGTPVLILRADGVESSIAEHVGEPLNWMSPGGIMGDLA